MTRPLTAFPVEARQEISGVFADIDDTLTTDGRLTSVAVAAMERLQAAGIQVFPITGRPAGWCDHIARMWPVDAVVGEQGAFYFRYDPSERRFLKRYVDGEDHFSERRRRLDVVADKILAEVPGCALASDHKYREFDLAIDFREDVAPLDDAAVARIVEIMTAEGMTAKVSSIHVNGWFGDYDKLSMTRTLMDEVFGIDLDAARGRYVFIGDSPNDQPMFEYFPHSIGVANIERFLPTLTTAPSYLSEGEGGDGFAELADALLSVR